MQTSAQSHQSREMVACESPVGVPKSSYQMWADQMCGMDWMGAPLTASLQRVSPKF